MAQTSQVELSQAEIEEAEERAMPRAAVVFETIRRAGEGELSRTISALTFSAISAGFSMGVLALHDERVRGVSAGYAATVHREHAHPDPGAAAPVRWAHILERRA